MLNHAEDGTRLKEGFPAFKEQKVHVFRVVNWDGKKRVKGPIKGSRVIVGNSSVKHPQTTFSISIDDGNHFTTDSYTLSDACRKNERGNFEGSSTHLSFGREGFISVGANEPEKFWWLMNNPLCANGPNAGPNPMWEHVDPGAAKRLKKASHALKQRIWGVMAKATDEQVLEAAMMLNVPQSAHEGDPELAAAAIIDKYERSNKKMDVIATIERITGQRDPVMDMRIVCKEAEKLKIAIFDPTSREWLNAERAPLGIKVGGNDDPIERFASVALAPENEELKEALEEEVRIAKLRMQELPG